MNRERLEKRLSELRAILQDTEWLDVEHHLRRIEQTLGKEAAKDVARKMIEEHHRWKTKHETN